MTMISFYSAEKPGVYDHIIINDNLTEAYNKLKDILMEVSKSDTVCH